MGEPHTILDSTNFAFDSLQLSWQIQAEEDLDHETAKEIAQAYKTSIIPLIKDEDCAKSKQNGVTVNHPPLTDLIPAQKSVTYNESTDKQIFPTVTMAKELKALYTYVCKWQIMNWINSRKTDITSYAFMNFALSASAFTRDGTKHVQLFGDISYGWRDVSVIVNTLGFTCTTATAGVSFIPGTQSSYAVQREVVDELNENTSSSGDKGLTVNFQPEVLVGKDSISAKSGNVTGSINKSSGHGSSSKKTNVEKEDFRYQCVHNGNGFEWLAETNYVLGVNESQKVIELVPSQSKNATTALEKERLRSACLHMGTWKCVENTNNNISTIEFEIVCSFRVNSGSFAKTLPLTFKIVGL